MKSYIINDRFRPQVTHQISDAVISELKYRLSTADISGKNESEVRKSLTDVYTGIVFREIMDSKESIFNGLISLDDYAKVLEVFNYKEMTKSIGHFFCLKDTEYCDYVIRQLNSSRAEEIKISLVGYLPPEIDRVR